MEEDGLNAQTRLTDFSIAAILALEEPRGNVVHEELEGVVFPCDKCKMIFTSPLYLENHHKSCYIKDGPRLTVEADKVPTAMSSLGRVSEGRTVYYCPYCNYQTTYIGSIRRHLLTHSGVKPYKCDVCGKRCTTSSQLTQHRRVHTGDKPYKCTDCSYSSSDGSTLKRHMARHTGERVYGCSECSYVTVSSGNMNAHKRRHRGEKTHHCPYCQYSAAEKKLLTNHIEGIHLQ